MTDRVTVAALQAMKREGLKIAAVVCWDPASAEVADASGVEIVSVGDSVVVSFDELLTFCRAVRRGVTHALVSCDLPDATVESARRLVDEGGADMVKVEGLDEVATIAATGIPVFAQLSSDDPVGEARRLEQAGAALIDFRHSGADAGTEVAEAVSIPVLGGLGGGPWLDGRVRAIHRLIGAEVAGYVADVRAGRPVKGD